MYHDPKGPRRRSWLSSLFSGGADDPVAVEPEQPEAESSPLGDLAGLAEQLAFLIESAQARLDGAVALVDRSADEAAAYGRALADDADAIDATGLPVAMVEALIGLTRTMIDRTQAAESRLRATNDQLRGLQQDLDDTRESAERDPLTGLPNRRALEHALRRAVAAAHSADTALSIAFCDIDHFKRVNDVHGHAVGDRVLRLVADCLVGDGEDGVFVGRQGGEEFVMLFEGVPVIDAAARVDAIREGLAGRSLRSRSDGTPIGAITFSAGVAALTTGETQDDLLQRADEALYRAKDGGRNQVVIDPGA